MEVESKKTKSTYRKSKRRLNSKFIILVCLILLGIIGVWKIPKIITTNNLKELGYSKETIEVIYEKDLKDLLLDNNYYSKSLEKNIMKDDFDIKYIKTYLVKEELSEDDKLLYKRLEDKKYNADQIASLFEKLDFYEITPLLVFDYQNDLTVYINDCIKNHSTNSPDYFVLDNNYYTHYENVEEVKEINAQMLVNKTYHLPDGYVPEKLELLPLTYASNNVYMQEEAAQYFKMMCDALIENGLKAYASNSYRSYNYQKDLYKGYSDRDGVEKADTYAARPGFSEHQTGLATDLASMQGGLNDFDESDEYNWLKENGHNYGFIQRYPANKKAITGYDVESWHWRYVGVEVATKLKESHLTYDEYFELYLK